MLAVGPRRAAEVPALNVPTLAGTALGAATRDPGLARLQERKGSGDPGGERKAQLPVGMATFALLLAGPRSIKPTKYG